MKILITSGGTVVHIDSVRKICNMSRGTFGSKIAEKAWGKGHNITFLYAKESKVPKHCLTSEPIQDIKYVEYETFDDYSACLDEQLKLQPDIIILAAAVSDYGVENRFDGKIRSGDDLVIRLKPLPKLISTVRVKCPKAVICGFKLLVNSTNEELLSASISSLINNRCDLIIGNDLRDIKKNDHILTVVEKTSGVIKFGEYKKSTHNLAQVVVDKCLEHWDKRNLV